MTHDLRFMCRRCHRFEPITGKTFCAECAREMQAMAVKDQKLAKLNSEVEEHPELGWGA